MCWNVLECAVALRFTQCVGIEEYPHTFQHIRRSVRGVAHYPHPSTFERSVHIFLVKPLAIVYHY